MADISATQWLALSPLLDELLEAQGETRVQRLAQIRRDDAALAGQLETLLGERTGAERDAFLEGGIFGVAQEPSLAGQTIGAYTLREAIGHGGMGSVWRAERSDGRYQGTVAVKFLNLALLGRGGAERFAREGSMLARLTHPNIARLWDAGVATSAAAGGQPYLVLEYIEGVPIDRYCDANRLSIEQRLRLFLDVLAAVAHAHINLILHRDLKPSNILVTAQGQVKLLDFGIGKLLAEQDTAASATELTRLAGHAFTPDYAAPEQVQGGDVTTATDVYALGVLLYQLLTGRHPTALPTHTAVDRVRAVVEREPPPVSEAAAQADDAAAQARATVAHKLARTLRGDLDNIVAKALKKQATERYPTVAALADDLRRHLDHEPVSARADSLAYRTAKFVRRYRFGVAAVAAIFAALIAGVAGTTWQAIEASRQRDAARFEAAHAEASSEFMSLMLEEAGEGGQPLPLPEMLNRAVQLLEKQYGDDPSFVSNMLVQLARRYMDLSQQGKALELLARSASIAESLNNDALLARALCASAHAGFKSFVNRSAEAELARGLAALARLRNPPVDLQVDCLRTQAILARRHAEPGSAIALLTQAHELHQKNGETRGLQYTSVLVDLGGVYLQESRLAEAYATSLEVVQAFDRNGRGGTLGKMTAEANLAVVLSRMGEIQAAARLEQRVLQRSNVLGTAETARLSYAVNYASSLLRLEQPHAARDLLHGVSQRFRLEKDDFWAAVAEFHLSRALFVLGETDAADSHFAEAQRLLQQEPKSNAWFLTRMALERVRMNLAQGNGGAARADIDALLQQLEYPQRRSSGELRSALALATEVYLQAAQPEQAAAFAGDAYDIARKMARQVDQSADVGETAYLLAKARYALGRSDEAGPLLQQAVKSLGNGLGLEHRLTREAGDLLARLERTDSRALGEIAKKAGIVAPEAATALPGLLPQVVDTISPDDKSPSSNDLGVKYQGDPKR